MRSENGTAKPAHVTQGDIFDDLGFSPEETMEAKIKAQILHAIIQHSERQGMSQAHLASAIGAHQPDVSNLLRGKISRFTITRLLQFAARLDLEARIRMVKSKTPHGTGERRPMKSRPVLAA